MMGNAVKSLKQYENDPVAIAAMKEASHSSLYAIANSCAMNGMGKDTIVKAVIPNYKRRSFSHLFKNDRVK